MIFRADGAILEIMAIMRSVNFAPGNGLSVLSPFCNDSTFLDMTLTQAQLIQHFGLFFQTHEKEDTRRFAGEVLEVFIEGLEGSKSLQSSRSFIDSGIIFILQNIISDDSAGHEWRQQGTALFCALMEDKRIREVFLAEPLGVLHCLVSSKDSYERRSPVIFSLVRVLEVVASDPDSHPRLFESDILIDLAEHIKATLTTDVVPDDATKAEYSLQSLNIFDIIATSEESSNIFKQMKLEVFLNHLQLLLPHDQSGVRDLVTRILAKIGSSATPSSWKMMFQKVTRFF
jgi:hypothetical protein